MERDIDARVEAYLDGMLSSRDAADFERQLANQPEISRALSAALLVRDLLATMPPVQAPAGLSARIERALEIDTPAPDRDTEREPRWSRLRAALGAAAFGLRGPAWAIDGSRTAGASAMAGMAQMRWALGPWAGASFRDASQHGGHESAEQPEKKPLWRRALALAWRS